VTINPHSCAHAHLEFAAYLQTLASFTAALAHPEVPLLLRRFLHDQLCAYNEELPSDNIPLDELPEFNGTLRVHTSASVVFYAPSELAGTGGMHREVIRSTALWYRSYERRDTVLYQDPRADQDDPLGGMTVGRVLHFISFTHNEVRYPCAFVKVFERAADEVDPLTGMWVVRPLRHHNGRRRLAVVHTHFIFRACHIIARYGTTRIPPTFHFSRSHVAFRSFYLNHYADYHACECIPRV
jgi:hypothetical protein